MEGYLPEIYERFATKYPDVMRSYEQLAQQLHAAGPLSGRERRLAKLGIAVGGGSEGAVRSHARKAIAEAIEPDAILQVAVLAISTAGYPAAIAAYQWINQVLDKEA
jgi:alkylhydroperoxidase/carboxymuconolactone decarboxylase family protein YurZ